MKLLLCHVFVLAVLRSAGNPDPASRVTRSVSFLALPHVPFSRQPPTTRRRRVVSKSHIELVVSDGEHTLAPFHSIIYNK